VRKGSVFLNLSETCHIGRNERDIVNMVMCFKFREKRKRNVGFDNAIVDGTCNLTF
jgi:hypothetical protein